jgi:DMSO/TMAO reductase YedYZ molybdopterin-dependent catalytic subunit
VEINKNGKLKVLGANILNAETNLTNHYSMLTDSNSFFKRNRVEIPVLSSESWSLNVFGQVKNAKRWSYDEITSLPSKTIYTTMECAGNARSDILPTPRGNEP